jgi:hypothetical protein
MKIEIATCGWRIVISLGACRDENFPYVESIGYGQSHACKLLILRR